MTVVAGPVVRIEPAQAAGTPDVWTSLFEFFAPADTYDMVAVITASALSGQQPAMGTIRIWNKTINGFEQTRIYGTQTVTVVLTNVTAGDLIQIAAQPYSYTGVWDDARVWCHMVAVTLSDYTEISGSAPTYAPPLPPTQLSVLSVSGGTALTYSWGESWGPTPSGTSWRFRPVGGDTWQVHTASNHIPVTLPFHLADAFGGSSGFGTQEFGISEFGVGETTEGGWEVQGAQTTAGGTSAWGETVVWTVVDTSGGGGGGYGLTPYGTNYGS